MPGRSRSPSTEFGQTITPPVLINEKPQVLPRRVNLPLQEIIDRFDYLRQRLLLQDVIRQLQVLRVLTPSQRGFLAR